MGRALVIIGLSAAGLLACGCSEKLETGYEPRRLGISSAERRAYYALPYSPEANAAQKEGGGGSNPSPGFRHPGD
jgi:hypothetical protein